MQQGEQSGAERADIKGEKLELHAQEIVWKWEVERGNRDRMENGDSRNGYKGRNRRLHQRRGIKKNICGKTDMAVLENHDGKDALQQGWKYVDMSLETNTEVQWGGGVKDIKE